MNFEKLCKMQNELDNRIIAEKNIQWTENERFSNTLVALDVELSEFANDARWFKVWSENQYPKSTTLEEFSDAVHFFLSLANQKGWQQELYLYEEAVEELREKGFDGGLNGIYLEMKVFLFRTGNWKKKDGERATAFRTAWFLFISIGMVGFNFTWEQIEQEYLRKNGVNHARQNNGY